MIKHLTKLLTGKMPCLGEALKEATMQNREYFTPQIEDIRAGYVCEMRQADYWIPYHVSFNECLSDMLQAINEGALKVPYLTKDQIIEEGWNYIFLQGEGWVFEKQSGPAHQRTNFKLQYNFASRIMEVSRGNQTYYFWKCKDINTLRLITKLLEL